MSAVKDILELVKALLGLGVKKGPDVKPLPVPKPPIRRVK